MNKLINSWAVVDGTPCGRVRGREHSEEVLTELRGNQGEGCSYTSKNEAEPLDSTPSLPQFIEISHTTGCSYLIALGRLNLND